MKKKSEEAINKDNQILASGININRLLTKSSDKAIKVDRNGKVKIDYNNPTQKEWAEDWLK